MRRPRLGSMASRPRAKAMFRKSTVDMKEIVPVRGKKSRFVC